MTTITMIGHEGHGKSALAVALTNTAGTKYNILDSSGKVTKVKKLLSKLAQADVAVLVVSALDGPMPQTREHIILAKALRVSNLVVFVNKVDAVEDPEVLELIELETRDLLTTYGYDGEATAITYGSASLALSGDTSILGLGAIDSLISHIDTSTIVTKTPVTTTHKKFSAVLNALDVYQGGRHTPIRSGFTPSFFFDVDTVTGAIETPIDIAPGGEGAIVVSLIKATGLKVGSVFVVREGNKTIGTGTVLNIVE